MAKDLFTEIRVKYNTLSKNQKIVANYILENRDKCVRMTLNELGRECNLSETTIIRFINKLDYKSYQSFRLDMAQDLSRHDAADSPKGSEYQEIKSGDSAEEVKQKVISIASSAITDINNLIPVETVTEAAKLIEEKTGVKATVINPYYITGVDKEMLESLKADHKTIITLEDGVLEGGFGEKRARFYGDSDVKTLCFGLEKKFYDRYDPAEVLKENHLTPEQIAEDVIKTL